MPLQKLQFRPGVNRESTTLANEGGWFESDKVRFRSGYPEKIGGWVKDTGPLDETLVPPTGTFWGICRNMWNWITLSGYNLLALGTNLKYYLQNGPYGAFYDITPLRETTGAGAATFTAAYSTLSSGISATATSLTVASGTNFPSIGGVILIDTEQIAYSGKSTNTLTGLTRGYNGTTAATHSTSAGVGSYTLTVTDSGWGGQTGDFVTFSGAVTLGGVITAAVLNAEFEVTYVSTSTYTITAATAANASDVGNGGSNVVAAYQISTGGDIFTVGVGWGAGVWGSFAGGSGWGSPAPSGLGVGLQLRLWSQSNYGQNLVFNPRGGAIYYWVVDSTPTIFNRGQVLSPNNTNTQNSNQYWLTDATCPTICNFVLVSDASRFVIAFGTNDPTAIYATAALDPMQIRWSDQEDLQTWTPASTNQAGDYRLSNGSAIIVAIQTRQEILVLTDSAIYSMQYLGPPYVWGFQVMGENISIISPSAIATVNNVTYWMGVDKFYMYSGRVETLPCALRQYIYQDINLDQGFQVISGTNEGYNEVWWHYCSITGPNGTGTPANPNTLIDSYVIFNHLERTWYYGTWGNSNNLNDGRTAWLDSSLRANPMAAVYGTPGGAANGILVYHENGVDDGAGGTNNVLPIDSYVQSSDFDIGDGHNYGLVWRLIPDVTFDGSTVNQPSVDFTVRPRTNPGANYGTSDAPTVASTQNYTNQLTYNVQQFTQIVYVRLRGRQMAFKVSSNDLGVAWQLGAPRIDVRPDGRR
jgi:hypothetical protein